MGDSRVPYEGIGSRKDLKGGFGDFQTDSPVVDVEDDEAHQSDDEFDIGLASRATLDERYFRAAVFVEDAIHTRTIDHLLTHRALTIYHYFHTSVTRSIVTANILLQLSLAFFEEPTMYPLQWPGADLLLNCVEFFCLAVYGLELVARYMYQGRKSFWADMWNRSKVIVISCMTIDAILFVSGATPMRYTRVLRPFFVLEKKRVKSIVVAILRTLPRILDVFFLGLFFLFVFGVIGYLLFMDTPQHQIFPTLGETYIQLLILITTANFPDVMMPAYRTSRFYALYFIFFLIFTLYIIMNLVMAVIYTHYRYQQQREVIEAIEIEQKGLNAAFQELNHHEDGTIDYSEWARLFRALRPKFSPEKVRLMFLLVDYDDNRTLDSAEFGRLARVLKLRIKHLKAKTTARQRVNAFNKMKWGTVYDGARDVIAEVTSKMYFDIVIDVVIVFSAIAAYYETIQMDDPVAEANKDFLRPLQYVFSIIFCTEVSLRIFGQGFRAFWKSSWSRFDLIVVVTSFITENIKDVGVGEGSGFLRIMLLIRVFRLFRLINGIKRFKVIVGTVFGLIPALGIFFKLLVAVYYFFAVVGMEAFAYRVFDGNPAVAGTLYDDADYYVNNFDSFPVAMVTLFELMVVNNWHVIMSGFSAAVGYPARVFFIVWWLVCVVLILNVIVAFVLEAYFLQWEVNANKKEQEHKLNFEIARAEARLDRRTSAANLSLIEAARDSDTIPWELRWKAEPRQHVADLLRSMHEGELKLSESPHDHEDTEPYDEDEDEDEDEEEYDLGAYDDDDGENDDETNVQ